MTAQIEFSRDAVHRGAGKSDLQRPADKIRIHGELHGFAGLRREKNVALVVEKIGRTAFRRAALPNLDF